MNAPNNPWDRWLFGLGALYTCGIGCTVLAAPAWAGDAFYRHRFVPDDQLLLIVTGDLAGMLVFASMCQRFAAGVATGVALGAGIGDLIFAGLFTRFLWRSRR